MSHHRRRDRLTNQNGIRHILWLLPSPFHRSGSKEAAGDLHAHVSRGMQSQPWTESNDAASKQLHHETVSPPSAFPDEPFPFPFRAGRSIVIIDESAGAAVITQPTRTQAVGGDSWPDGPVPDRSFAQDDAKAKGLLRHSSFAGVEWLVAAEAADWVLMVLYRVRTYHTRESIVPRLYSILFVEHSTRTRCSCPCGGRYAFSTWDEYSTVCPSSSSSQSNPAECFVLEQFLVRTLCSCRCTRTRYSYEYL